MSNLKTLIVDKFQMDDLFKSVNLYDDSQIYLNSKVKSNDSNEKDLANKLGKLIPDPFSFLMKFLALNTDIPWCVVKWDNGEFEVCRQDELEAIDNPEN
mgnify:FL=1